MLCDRGSTLSCSCVSLSRSASLSSAALASSSRCCCSLCVCTCSSSFSATYRPGSMSTTFALNQVINIPQSQSTCFNLSLSLWSFVTFSSISCTRDSISWHLCFSRRRSAFSDSAAATASDAQTSSTDFRVQWRKGFSNDFTYLKRNQIWKIWINVVFIKSK